MSIGTNTYIDDLLAEYQPVEVADQSFLKEVFEDETNALLYAVLVELRGDDGSPTEAANSYSAFEEQSVTTSETKLEWDYPARAVLLYSFSEPIHVAFKEPGQSDRLIPLDPGEGDEPAEFSPPGGLGSEALWIQRHPDATADDTCNIVVFG